MLTLQFKGNELIQEDIAFTEFVSFFVSIFCMQFSEKSDLGVLCSLMSTN